MKGLVLHLVFVLTNVLVILFFVNAAVSDRGNGGLEDNHHNFFVRNLVKKKQGGTFQTPIKINNNIKPLVTTFKPIIIPKFSYNTKEPQWLHEIDQIQIESQPNRHQYHTQAQANIQLLPIQQQQQQPQQQPQQQLLQQLHPRLPVQKGYDLTTLMIVSIVSAILGALTFSVVDGQRSLGNSGLTSFSSLLNVLDVETVAKFFTTISDWEDKFSKLVLHHDGKTAKTNVISTPVNTSAVAAKPARAIRTTRETKTTNLKFFKWFLAYKKDPVELKCIQKLICQTLATSSCARSINTDVGASIMNILKYFVTSAGDISDLITDTMNNPKVCLKISSSQLCDDGESQSSETTTIPPEIIYPLPTVNLTSITPRFRYI